MKRTIVTILAFAAVLCAASSCKYDKCKCTTKVESEKVNSTSEDIIDLPDGKKCSDFDSHAEALGVKTSVTCKGHHE